MKIKELRTLGKAELKSKIIELKKELSKQNAQIAIGTVPKSPGLIRDIKKTIARILTIINEPKKTQKSGKVQKPSIKSDLNKKSDKKQEAKSETKTKVSEKSKQKPRGKE